MSLSIVVATDEQGGIGKDMEIPWYIREDMCRFKEITTKIIEVRSNRSFTPRKFWSEYYCADKNYFEFAKIISNL